MASAPSSKSVESSPNNKWQVSYIYHTQLFKEELSSSKPLPYAGEIVVFEGFRYIVHQVVHDIEQKVTTIYLKGT